MCSNYRICRLALREGPPSPLSDISDHTVHEGLSGWHYFRAWDHLEEAAPTVGHDSNWIPVLMTHVVSVWLRTTRVLVRRLICRNRDMSLSDSDGLTTHPNATVCIYSE